MFPFLMIAHTFGLEGSCFLLPIFSPKNYLWDLWLLLKPMHSCFCMLACMLFTMEGMDLGCSCACQILFPLPNLGIPMDSLQICASKNAGVGLRGPSGDLASS